MQTADCNLWRVLPDAGRRKVLAAFRSFFGASVPGAPSMRGPVLSNKQAQSLFTSYCRQSFAGAFKLYKIYGRAAAFTPAGG
jgi:hypothetical protein